MSLKAATDSLQLIEPPITKREREALLRKMMDHIGHGKKIFPHLTVDDWLKAFAREELGIDLEGDGNAQ
jgi:hypothetical protein